jgi:ABC-type sugar transport system ATPase subunit/O-glycosyl hydrolase
VDIEVPAGPARLVMSDVRKRFGGVQALRGVSIEARGGEVLALVGENGAGKSTLLKILSGAYTPDAGSMSIDGPPARFISPHAAHAAGVRVIYQEPEIIPHVSVAENIYIGELPSRAHVFRWRSLQERARADVARFGFAHALRPETLGEQLSPAQRQLIEIMRALIADVRVIAFDEPTSSLSDTEVEALFTLIRRLRDEGVAIVYVSHRLPEIFAIADRVTVLRDGAVVGTREVRWTSTDELVSMMVGRDLTGMHTRDAHPHGDIILSVRGRASEAVTDVNFDVRAGEVIGISGLVGAGRSELARAIVGSLPRSAGDIRIAGHGVRIRSSRDAIRAGIGFVPEERKAQALLMDRSVRDNTSLAVLPRISRMHVVRRGEERRIAAQFVRRLNVRTPSLEHVVADLSGGSTSTRSGKTSPKASCSSSRWSSSSAAAGRRPSGCPDCRPRHHREVIDVKTLARTVVAAAVLAAGGTYGITSSSFASAATQTSIAVDLASPGRTFDGVGALSAGASSRLLIDYPEPQRSQILDYLFRPGYGAALQILKVEIGGDTNSTAGSEPSHMRSPEQADCTRGYEWWLMEQAKARNPDIEIDALAWGAPGWLRGGIWSDDYIDYLISWVGCAKAHGIGVDYIGGLNEKTTAPLVDYDWYKRFKQALRDHGIGARVVCCDLHPTTHGWDVADAMREDPQLYDAIDVIGVHAACTDLVGGRNCVSPASAPTLGKALSTSELPLRADHNAGAAETARALNRDYLDGRMTSTIKWALIAGWYPSLTPSYAGRGLIRAYSPWSGNYEVGKTIWSIAQTTQFTRPGWRYLDDASGYLPGGSYVTLAAPNGGDYSTVIETLDATGPQRVDMALAPGASTANAHVWSTDLRSSDPADYFVHESDVTPVDGRYAVDLQPGHVYTISTATGQGRGTAQPPADDPMKLPNEENFEHVAPGQSPRYFADVEGAFETVPCTGRAGRCLKQMITQSPITWHQNVAAPIPPSTLVGDSTWRDYTASVDTRLGAAGWVELMTRVDGRRLSFFPGYHLRVERDGRWRLYIVHAAGDDDNEFGHNTVDGSETELASGTVPFDPNAWHRLRLTTRGYTLIAELDGKELVRTAANSAMAGQVGLIVSPWDTAQFDDFGVTPRPAQGSLLTAQLDARELTAQPGVAAPLGVTVTNPGPAAATQVQPRPQLPPGWTARPVVVGDSELAVGASSHWTWDVTPPASTRPDSYDVGVATSYRSHDQTGPVTAGGTALVGVIPHGQLTATATSAQSASYAPAHAVDGDASTMWHSQWSPALPLPQSLTVDLGGRYDVSGVRYHPRQDGNLSGVITGYRVYGSPGGTTWTALASGTWPADAAVKTVELTTHAIRFVRLEAVTGSNNLAQVSELDVLGTPSGG